MRTIYKFAALSAGILVSLASCSDNEWTPGPAAPDNMGVYFSQLPPAQVQLSNEDDLTATATLSRLDATAAASVPITFTSNVEGFVVPATVEFAAGQKSADITIDFSNVPLRTQCDLKLAIDPDYANQYAAGTSTASMQVQVAEWLVLADEVRYDFRSVYDGKYYHGQLLNLESTELFMFKDFMGSGLDLKFTVNDPKVQYPAFTPVSNARFFYEVYPDDEDSNHSWYLYNTALSRYPQWSPDPDSDIDIMYLNVYSWNAADSYPRTYIGINTGYAHIYTYATFSDGTRGWFRSDVYFTPKYNPFVDGWTPDEEAE